MLKIYNDWIIDDWGGGAGRGKLIPLTLVPLWDPVLAAEEVRRCASKGSYAIAFSENPSKLGCATMYSGEWDVLWDACQEADVTVSMHIGSSSSMPTTSPDAPLATSMSLYAQNARAPSSTGCSRERCSDSLHQDRVCRESGRLDAVPA